MVLGCWDSFETVDWLGLPGFPESELGQGQVECREWPESLPDGRNPFSQKKVATGPRMSLSDSEHAGQ